MVEEQQDGGASPEGVDGSVIAYRERLHAPVWLWLVATALVATLGIAYGYRLGLVPGVVTFLLSEALVVALLLVTAPVVVVDDAVVRAGRARLPLRHVGRVAVLDADHTRNARGTGADRRAYLCQRSFISGSVLIEVEDAEDPHPYWLVSTRRGSELAPLLGAARDAARDVTG